jgi:hypothetical protein
MLRPHWNRKHRRVTIVGVSEKAETSHQQREAVTAPSHAVIVISVARLAPTTLLNFCHNLGSGSHSVVNVFNTFACTRV